jgi:hypothetical protein
MQPAVSSQLPVPLSSASAEHVCLPLGFVFAGTQTKRTMAVSKSGLFEPFISKNEHLTKTGSGQT